MNDFSHFCFGSGFGVGLAYLLEPSAPGAFFSVAMMITMAMVLEMDWRIV